MPNGEDVDASFGPSAVLRSVWTRPGQVQGTCPPLAHTRRSRAHILTASATTIHENGDGTDSNRFPDCSVIPGNPSTEQTGEFPWGFHETKRETTPDRLHWARYAGRNFTDRQRIKRKAQSWGRRYAALPVGERLAVLGAMMAVEAQR